MAIQIKRREVFNNLIHFKDNLLHRAQQPFLHKRIYNGLANRHTGNILFGQPSEKIASSPDWQKILLVVEEDAGTVNFQITNPEGSSIQPNQFDPIAARILLETLDVLNQLAALYHAVAEMLPEDSVLQNLSDIQITDAEDPIEQMPGWCGKLSRIQAEKKLLSSPPGVYLFHTGDQIAEDVAKDLGQTNHMDVKAYALTFVEADKKISEKLLLHTQKGWTVCRDESNLLSPVYQYFPTLKALLLSFRDQANSPLRD